MGFETYQVRLCEPQSEADAIDAYLHSLPQVATDRDAFRIGDARYYLWRDATHVIEIKVDREPPHLSARFTLCHPPSIAVVLAGMLTQLQQRFGGRLVIADEVPPGRPYEFTSENLGDFRPVLQQSVAVRRADWIAQFGSCTLSATSQDVYREFILPLSEREAAGSPVHAVG